MANRLLPPIDDMSPDPNVTPNAMLAFWSNQALLGVAVLLLGVVGLSIVRFRRRRQHAVVVDSEKVKQDGPNMMIEPLVNFDWKTEEPRKLRPFKTPYHITMGLRSDTPSDLITIDKDYLHRVNMRRSIIKEQGRVVYGCIPSGEAAVRELYEYLMGDYLPTRYPTIFKLSCDKSAILNAVTGFEFPTKPPSSRQDTGDGLHAALRILGETVEEDMFLLHETPDGHFTSAFLCCFPAGFDPSDKLGILLREVHKPVPSYEKIGSSMERFFCKLEVGKSVKRINWTVQTYSTLFTPKPHPTREDDHATEATVKDSDRYARMELQTLTRLPKSRSILFSFKTYLYSLSDIKEEGLGHDLADAIEGLGSGNAPGMRIYKGSTTWAGPVCEYLRS